MRILTRLLELFPHDTIKVDGKPYLSRYFLTGRQKSHSLGERAGARIHCFHTSDPGPDLHNHPWSGLSIILSGGYRERRRKVLGEVMVPVGDDEFENKYKRVQVFSAEEVRTLRPGSVNVIGLEDYHAAELLDPAKGCWTIFFTGRRKKDWGFLDSTERFIHWSQYTGRGKT